MMSKTPKGGWGMCTACLAFLLLDHLVSSQFETQGTQMPSFSPVWHTPGGSWSKFSNPVPWTTKDKVQGQGQGSKGQSEKGTRVSVSDHSPLTSTVGVTQTWARPDPGAIGVPVSMVSTDTLLQLSGSQFINSRAPVPERSGPSGGVETHRDEDFTPSLLSMQNSETDESESVETRTSDTQSPEPHQPGTESLAGQKSETLRLDTSSRPVGVVKEEEEAVMRVVTTLEPIVDSEHGGIDPVTALSPSVDKNTGTFDDFAGVRDTATTTNRYGGSFSVYSTPDLGKARSDSDDRQQLPQRLQPFNTGFDRTSHSFQQSVGSNHQTSQFSEEFQRSDGSISKTREPSPNLQQPNKSFQQTSHPPQSFQSNGTYEHTLQTRQPSERFPQSNESTHQTSQSSRGFQQFPVHVSDTGSRNGTDSENSPLLTHRDGTAADTVGMDQNSSERPQSVQPQDESLVITKLEDLHDSELDSDLLFKAVEIDDGTTNSTEVFSASNSSEWNVTDADNNGNNPFINASEVLTKDGRNGTSELGQFHLPDDDCLYDVYGASGTLTFPDAERFPVFSAKEFITCRWRVRVPEGPNIKVSVERLALSLGVEQLEIAVGLDGELKKRTFTGSKTPRDLVTLGRRLWLSARVRNDDYGNKIVLHFQQTEQEAVFPTDQNYTCGAILTDLSGNITSPGYTDPGHYENNQECLWYIVAPAQSVIRVTILHFSTDVYDHVTMGIGLHAGASDSKLLTLYGHLQEQRETVIPANSLWIHFASDDSDTQTGFFISYQVLPRDICNVTDPLTAEEGLITSVDYPRIYPINSECTWYIRAPPGTYVNLTFFDLYVEDGRDFVLIGEGKDLFGGPFTTFTGNTTGLNPVRVDSSDVWIHFSSDHLDGDLPYRGFSLSYKVLFYQPPTSQHSLQDADVAIETTMRPEDEDNMILKDVPMNDQGQGRVITIPLAGVNDEQLNRKMKEFRSTLALLLNEHCSEEQQDKCQTKHKLTADAISVVGRRREQGRLLVEVRVEADVSWPTHTMAAADYEELERLFHSDLQTLDLQDEDASDTAPSHLPEWLIGVIVVVILLIVAFFAMVIYSLMKERKKKRAGSYGGTTSTGSVCEDLEGGKTDGNIRITAFSLEQAKEGEGANGQAGDGSNSTGWTLDSEVASTLQRRQHGVSGCMNPAFIDDDAAAASAEKGEGGGGGDEPGDRDNTTTDRTKSEEKTSKQNGKTPTSTGPKPSPSPSSNSKSQNSKPPKTGGEELEMKGNVAGGQGHGHGQGQKNGSVVNRLNDLSKEAETTDEETAIDEREGEDGGRGEGRKKKKEEEGAPDTAGSQREATTTSSSGPRQLEVVMDRDSPPSACVTVHRDSGDSEGDKDHVLELSTDGKEDAPGMSTNL